MKMLGKRKVVLLLRISLVITGIVGLVFVFSKPITNIWIHQGTESMRINRVNPLTVKENQRLTQEEALERIHYDYESVQPISPQAVLKAQFQKNDYPIIAEIAIPSIMVNLPIFLGVSNEALLYGAGTLTPNQEMGIGNYGLISHLSYDPNALFSPLANIRLGAEIYLTDLSYVYIYQTTEKFQITPEEIWVLEEISERQIVTLITCTDFGAEGRLVVRGDLIDMIAIEETSQEILNVFDL